MPSVSDSVSHFSKIQMTIRTFMAAASAVVLMMAMPCTETEARGVKESRKRLKTENTRLRNEIDSLKLELEKYRMELHATDSVVNEFEQMYAENEDKADTLSLPEEYTAETSDSLLNLWYAHKMVIDEELPEYDMDSVKFSSNVPDEVYIERIRNMNSFITLPYNDIVKNYIILYSEKMKNIGKVLGLCEYYMPIFQEIFSRYDMPEELKAMAVIESSLNPLAVSRVGAKGMWQFMYNTAKIYGLHIDSFVDERLDPVRSADAAARYLMDSYKIFGDWNLAIASYNCGAGNVNRAIRRSGGKRAFWDIWPYLPRETRGYVPAFVGALYTMTYYKEHGIRPEHIQMPAHVDTFKINRMLHFKQISAVAGVPVSDLKNLNPQYRHEIIPGNDREYILRLPYTYTNDFIDKEDSIYAHKADSLFNPVTIKKIKDGGDGERIVYRVKNGDYLGKIAGRYRVSVAQIRRWNNLKNNNIRVGQRLIIYRGGRAPSSAKPAQNTAKTAKQAQKPQTQTDAAQGKFTIYIVKSGDSLYTIAKNYPGVSAKNIQDFNGISGSRIRPGMKLKIPVL